jgi:hypothetical protein
MEQQDTATRSCPRKPDAKLAASIATQVIGHAPIAARRFTTGARHYVFEIEFSENVSVVVRVGDARARSEIEGAIYLSNLLRPKGVPLPILLAHDTTAEFPWIMLERLPGTDLGAVIPSLTNEQLDHIAAKIARAQSIAAKTGSQGRYGYAVHPENAPYTTWSHVLDASVSRSRGRIERAGLFDVRLVDAIQAEITSRHEEFDRIEAVPFLHDTTTKNVIVTQDGTLSGIVDVDDLCFGDSRYPAALTKASLMARGYPTSYVSAWLKHSRQPEDEVFRLYVSLFLLDLMSENGHTFNSNQTASTPEARATLLHAFDINQPR